MSLRGIISCAKDPLVIDHPIGTDYEATRILLENQNRVVRFMSLNGGEAVGNLYSTRESVCRALSIETEELMPKLIRANARPIPAAMAKAPGFNDVVTEKFDLKKLPIPKFYPKDGGRYITAGVAVSEYEGKSNLSFHRLMLLDKGRFAIRLVPRHLFTMYKAAMAKGKDLPVAFCIGLSPSVLLAAATSTDYLQNEMEIASALSQECTGHPLEVARLRSGLVVPAHSEYVLEGRLTAEMVEEGPFVDITGTYDDIRSQPVFKVDRVYRRRDPVFQIVLPGGLEHYLLMGLPREPMIFKAVNQVVPMVHGVRLTEGGCCWLHGVVSITKNKEGDAANAIMAAFTGHPSMKRVIIVDSDVDIYDDRQVEWAVATRFQAHRGLLVVNNAAGSSLDPSAEGTTSKVGIDATKPPGKTGFELARLD
ncbi:MAG: UbiD family decarboxylase [Methanomassiliicoccales archaeon]|nr:UbiD family decarboxylase [Methanomassiliicoccales archaeon]